jgi:prepilin-type N-terminal cleavage/methylation domain-containing protein
MQKKGFTLIELLVVIAIIAILAAILFPVFARAKASAKNTQELSQARQIGMGVKLYLGDYDDTMPIFYAYNSQPPAGQVGHKGVEVLLDPYIKNRELFRSPWDVGGPYTADDVPGSNSYFEAYGSSFRFTKCLYTIVPGESTQNNAPLTYSQAVTETSLEFPAETRIMRPDILPWFSNKVDTTCERYGYDCPAPNNYYRQWSDTGGSIIFADGHAKFLVNAGQFDQTRVNPEGRQSGEATGTGDPFDDTWYWRCD